MESFWKYNTQISERSALENNTHIHTVIIGAGMAGVLTAYLLKQCGIESVIVEAKTIGGGQTENTTAKITSQHDMFFSKLISSTSYFRPYWYVATGFKKWGMTSSMVAAMILSSLIRGRSDIYENAFSPQRLLVRAGMVNFRVDVGESVCGLTKGFFYEKKRRCTHMGCRLEWNNEEDSWDCPCHGSRYDKNGEILDNPAQTDKNLR